MPEQLQASVQHRQLPASAGSSPTIGYSVPASIVSKINAPQRWRRWVGYNVLAFSIGCVSMLLGTFVMALISHTVRNGLQQFVEKLSFNVAGVQAIAILLGFPLFLSIGVASIIQRAALYQQVAVKSWVAESAVSGLGAAFLVVSVIIISIMQRSDPPPSINYLWIVFTMFLIISTGISYFQWRQLRTILIHAWHWPLIAIATWTGLGTLIVGLGMGILINNLR
ncbi:hypothetical protein [Herpetosiphon sp. NSE202]|uniref:hypothetical protein n=1 Tax=Herpetosiphon sp. NSE202 TaxID=3351349 RepID=UPI0036280532